MTTPSVTMTHPDCPLIKDSRTITPWRSAAGSSSSTTAVQYKTRTYNGGVVSCGHRKEINRMHRRIHMDLTFNSFRLQVER